MNENHEDLKSYVPGGILVTSWDGSEFHFFPFPDAVKVISEGEKKWEIFLGKVEGANEGIGAELNEDEVGIAHDVFEEGGSVEDAVSKVADYAALMVVDYFDESMDGDHESALASCGWGTDEDYGCFEGGLEDF